jgi:hypothetical protein
VRALDISTASFAAVMCRLDLSHVFGWKNWDVATPTQFTFNGLASVAPCRGKESAADEVRDWGRETGFWKLSYHINQHLGSMPIERRREQLLVMLIGAI